MTDRLQDLADAGVSIWLDDLSRERIETGNLADLYKAYRLDVDAIVEAAAELFLA